MKPHFHIKWSSEKIDWEVYSSRADAEEGAKDFARPGETHTIEEFGEACPTCRNMMRPKSAKVIPFRQRKAG